MDDFISRQAALNIRFSDAINEDGVLYVPLRDFTNGLKALPSAQTEPITLNIDHELTQEEYEKLREDVANAPIILLPTADVIKVLRCKDCKHWHSNTEFCDQCQIEAFIDAQQTADVRENVKSEWIRWYEEIKHDGYTEYIPHCKCPKCGTEYDSHTVKFINFCPNCGAKMRGKS